tara:strand:- start:402 stop:854 length:453 start_codon:yes stop_codon:yes gene_type:complete
MSNLEMIRVLISLILITTLNTSLFACKTPKELMDNYFQDFNSANSKKIEKNFSFPFMVIQNGKKTIHNELSSFYDFENIKDTGWKESVINSVILILKKNKSAITQVNFSRINDKDTVYLTTDAYYILINKDDNWYISGIIIDGKVPLGKE